MKDRSILLGVTGGIAAYKSAELCRLFVKAGAQVQVVMSEAACEFITPLTLETLTNRPVHVKMFGRGQTNVEHIELSSNAELFVVAPATADFLARAAQGRANDLIAAVTLAFTGSVLVAPAMNTNMWNNPATQRNLRTLQEEHHYQVVQPGIGDLACGWHGTGRMADPPEIFTAAERLLRRDLDGRKVLVTAGPTVEDIDPVRFISNRSSGKMGFAIAEAAARRGADVQLICGPTALSAPIGVTPVPVRSALEMREHVHQRAEEMDAVIMAAAVSDFRPQSVADHKLKKKNQEAERTLKLVRNPDILAELGNTFGGPSGPILVGFAVETENLAQAARAKLEAKKAHLIVANLACDGFGGEDNQALIVDHRGTDEQTGRLSKTALADRILDRLITLWS